MGGRRASWSWDIVHTHAHEHTPNWKRETCILHQHPQRYTTAPKLNTVTN